MSLHAPFLVKQYLSNDLESGSYSRIFWYFPLDKEKSQQGGIGLFFEVLSGDVSDEIYEQITKRFWESFTDHFYADGFETSLKRSIKMFIQLLRNFDVEEGLDVNIVLFNVIPGPKGYMLKLISFGDSDIFVVREGKYADMGKMVPANTSLYDLKFLEVELDKGDTLMLGNKTLLKNAFEAEMLDLDSLDGLLRSLEAFKENLFGSKKLFIIAATETVGNEQKQGGGLKNVFANFSKIPALLSGISTQAKGIFASLANKTLPKKDETIAETDISALDFSEKEMPDAALDEITEELEEKESTFPEEPSVKPPKATFVPPPTLIEIEPDDSDVVNAVSELEDTVVTADQPLPGRSVTVDDFVVTDEITPSMTVEKSTYQDLVTDATNDSTQQVINKPSIQPIVARNGKTDYVQELRSMHSPWAKIVRNPAIRSAISALSNSISIGTERVATLLGRPAKEQKNKIYLSRPASLEAKKIQPGMIIIAVIVLLAIVLKLRGDSAQRTTEKAVLQTYQSSVADFMTFYDTNIAVIDKEDTERQLELCAPEAEKVLTTETNVLKKLKIEKNRQQVSTLTEQVKVRVGECETKADAIYGIVRVRNADIVTDFGLSLGNDSLVTSISMHNGALVVTDKGRKSVYLINVETKSVSKVEDPLALVSDPVSVGTGEGTLFICDRTNGILYFSGNATASSQGFKRMVGTEPTSVGDCLSVDGFAKNAYFIPATGNSVYRVRNTNSGYGSPEKYISDLLGARSLSIDGSIYVTSSADGVGDVNKYFGGKRDNFTLSGDNIGELTYSYTNPSNDKNIYAYDKTRNAIISIEKPTGSRHPGRGVVVKTYMLQNADIFHDIKGLVVDVNGNNKEVNMYILAGKTIWKIKL